ncbi:20936_t:CDS:2, partial [Cetraspora pellucida]
MTQAQGFITSEWTNGLTLNSRGIHVAKLPACNFKTQPAIILMENDKLQLKLRFSAERKTTFLLKNHIDPNAANLEQMTLISNIDNIFDFSKNPLNDELPVNDVYIEIQYPRIVLEFNVEAANPLERLIGDVKKAVEHHNPYQELIEIFKIYGFFLPKKVVLGHKLYRVFHLNENNSDKHKRNQKEYMVFDDFLLKHKEILNRWESCVESHNFDTNYLLSTNGKIVMRSDFNNFISSWSTKDIDINSLYVVDWNELFPLYEIFDDSLRQEIKYILGIDDKSKLFRIKEKILTAGVISINDSVCCYHVNFPYYLEPNDYKVFGKLEEKIGKSIKSVEQIIVKFKNMSTCGFSVEIENLSDIGSTRNISILGLGHVSFKPEGSNWSGQLKVKENLPKDSILVTSFECFQQPNRKRNFITNIQSYNKKNNEINITVTDIKYSDNDNFENQLDYLLQWCIILPIHQKIDSTNDNSILTVTTAHLKSLGQNIYASNQFDIGAAALIFGKDEDKYAYGESVLVTFHVHLPPNIERHGEPVIVGNCEELGGWKMITIKLTQPHRREYSTYWRSHPIDIRIGRDDIKYKYGIFNQSRRSIDYEGEGEIQNRTLDTRTNDQYDIWQNNKSHGIYNLREFAFVKCIYDAVNNENLKDKDKEEKRLFLCVLLGYHIKYRRNPYSFISQMPTHFRSDCLLEALQSVQYNTFTSNIKPIMIPVVVALVRHNATVRKSFEWLKIFRVAQVLDPNYSFVDGFMNVCYDSEHISHLLKEWPKIVIPHLDQLDDRVYNKIGKWLISFCSNMETLNIIWCDCIYHTSSIDREIANEINGCVYKIIAHDNASALYANFNKVLPEFLDMVANLFRERIINLLKSQQDDWDKNSLSALGKLLKDKQLYFEREDFLSAINCISQSTVFNLLNMFPELLEYWIYSNFHNTRSSEVTNICQQWFTRTISMLNYNYSMPLNEGRRFICVIYEHITRLQSLLSDKSNIYKTLIRVADEKIKKCSHNHILFATVQVATLNKSITTQFYNLIIENVLVARDIRSINNNLMEMICLICGQNNQINLENLDVPNSISENLLCHIMTCLESHTSQINSTEQQLDLIKHANFWRVIFDARGNVAILHKHSYATKIRTTISNLAGSIVDKTIDIKTLQAILSKHDDRQLSECLNVLHSPNAKKTFQSVIISENNILAVRNECKTYESRLRCLKAFYRTFCPSDKVVDSDVYTIDLEGKLKILSKVQLKEALSSRYWERHEDLIQKVAEACKFANFKTFTNMFETHLSQITGEIQFDCDTNALIPAVREEYIKIFKQYKDKKWKGIKYSEAFPLWKNVDDIKKELELINEVVYLGRNNHELEISIRNLTAIPKWEERIQKLSAVVEIFHVPVKTEDWLGRSLKILREDVLVLGKVVEFVKYCKDHNQTDNENYWSLIKELSSASDLLEFLQDIAENDIKNLFNGANDYSDERLIQADTVSSLIQVKQLVVQLMNKSNKIDEFLKVLLKNSQENPSLPNKITICAGSNMALQNMLRNISNRGEVTKEKIQNAVLRGTYTFEKDDKSDKFNVTLVYQANKSGEMKHIMSDLLDLRGRALLIAKPANISTDIEEENSRNIMTEFVLQVDTAQEVLNVGYKLIQMGHFDYRRFKKEIRGTEKRFGTTDMRDLLTKLKEDLQNWKQVVDEAQEEHYYLTFFPARHILAFYDYFTSDVQDDVNTETCRTLIKFVNSKAELPSRKDHSVISRKNTDYSHTLNEIGKKLQAIFENLLKTSRELKVRGDRIISDVVDKGKLCVAQCNDQLRVPNIIMSLYTNHGSYPEPWQILIYTKSTTIEELNILIKRCFFAAKNGYKR